MEIRYDLQNTKEAELIKIIDIVTNENRNDFISRHRRHLPSYVFR